MTKNTKKKSNHLKKDHLNWSLNKPIGINHLNALFDNLKKVKWYSSVRKKILIINIFFWFNREDKLQLQKEIFINNFNQYYNFSYSIIDSNDEFDVVYNKHMTIFKFFKPY